jgi:hypothetical protein
MNIVTKHPRKVISTHLRDWDERLPIFLLAYRAITNETTGPSVYHKWLLAVRR